MRFCCPHCDQAYYGTDLKGHLVPPQFECTQCGRAIDMDEMVLLPAEDTEDLATRVDTMPWLERQQIDELVELRRGRRVADDVVAVGDAEEFPTIHSSSVRVGVETVRGAARARSPM